MSVFHTSVIQTSATTSAETRRLPAGRARWPWPDIPGNPGCRPESWAAHLHAALAKYRSLGSCRLARPSFQLLATIITHRKQRLNSSIGQKRTANPTINWHVNPMWQYAVSDKRQWLNASVIRSMNGFIEIHGSAFVERQ